MEDLCRDEFNTLLSFCDKNILAGLILTNHKIHDMVQNYLNGLSKEERDALLYEYIVQGIMSTNNSHTIYFTNGKVFKLWIDDCSQCCEIIVADKYIVNSDPNGKPVKYICDFKNEDLDFEIYKEWNLKQLDGGDTLILKLEYKEGAAYFMVANFHNGYYGHNATFSINDEIFVNTWL